MANNGEKKYPVSDSWWRGPYGTSPTMEYPIPNGNSRSEPKKEALKKSAPSRAPDVRRMAKSLLSPKRLHAVPRVQAIQRETDPRIVMEKKRKWYFSR